MYATSRPYAGQDDPARVDPPDGWSAAQETQYYARLHEIERDTLQKVRTCVVAVLKGDLPETAVQTPYGFRTVNARDIFVGTVEDIEDETLPVIIPGYRDDMTYTQAALLLAVAGTQESKELIDAYCWPTVRVLAHWQMIKEAA